MKNTLRSPLSLLKIAKALLLAFSIFHLPFSMAPASAQTQAVVVNPATGTVTFPTPIIFTAGQIKIGSVSISGTTGTGNAVLATSPTLITPTLGSAEATIIQFGGLTSSFPMLKNSGAELQARLADDSADAAFSAQKLIIGNNSVYLVASGGALAVQNNSGGAAAITASVFNGPLAWSNLTSVPTTAAGYGIVNGAAIDTLGAKSLTGTGNIVLAASPTLTTPNIGAATATSINGITATSAANTFTITVGTASITAPSSLSGTLAASAITDTTNASNITSGTLPIARLPSFPKFRAKNSAAQAVSYNTPTKLTFDTPSLNAGGFYDASTSRWTPPAGAFFMGVNMPIDAGGWRFWVYKNGTLSGWMTETASGAGVVSAGATVVANGTDYLEIWATNFTGGTANVYSSEATSDATAYGFSIP